MVEGSALEPRTARLYVQLEGRTVAQRVFAPGPARCSDLHAALALALALAIRASAQQDLAAQPLDTEPSASEPFAQPEPALEWALSAAGLTAHGLLPALAPGLELALRRQLAEHVSLRLGAFAVAALGSELEQQDRAYDATLMVLRADAWARAQLATALHGAAHRRRRPLRAQGRQPSRPRRPGSPPGPR